MHPEFVLVDKPVGITSFGVVREVKRTFLEKRVGHLGTLDPFATGLLVVALGKMTRLLPLLQGLPKTYRAVARLGATSTTGDPEGEVTETGGTIPTRRAVGEAADRFRGEITQTPPAFSAVKVEGQRAYDLARAGITPELKARTVIIHELTVLRFEPPELEFDVTCSTGTYIRSLASDIGEALGCGAYLTSLRRTAIGPMRVEEAVTLERLLQGGQSALHILAGIVATQQIGAVDAGHLRNGRSIAMEGATNGPCLAALGERLIASGEVRSGVFHPGAVLL